MGAPIDDVLVVAMDRKRVEAGNADEQIAPDAAGARKLPQKTQWIRHVLEHMVRDNQVERRVVRNDVEPAVPPEGAIGGRLDAPRLPPAGLKRVQELSGSTTEIQHPGARRRCSNGQLVTNRLE